MEKEKLGICCPYCREKEYVKNGFVKYRQRYLCKNRGCSKNFYIDETLSKIAKRRQTIIMYLEGLDYVAIAKRLKISRHTISGWVEKCSYDFLKEIRNHQKTDEIPDIYTVVTTSDGRNKPIRQERGFLVLEKEKKTYISLLENVVKEVPYVVNCKIRKEED